MNNGRLVFSQITDVLDPTQLTRCMQLYPLRRSTRTFSARDQFLSMAFAQLTFRESLRDIEACLRNSPHLYAMGIRGNVTRTNLAYANEHRDWRVYEALGHILIRKARSLYASEDTGLGIEEMVYALDSTTIDLCLTLFPWATFRTTKSAIKLHTQIDLKGPIPVFIRITEGSVHDVNILDLISIEPGSIYVLDRGYVDFARLFRIETAKAFFVTRAKRNLKFYVVASNPVDKTVGLKCDQVIRLSIAKSKSDYAGKIRRIHYVDPETGQSLIFLTNHFALPAITIASIYKSRWTIELFFKWIKQNLRIKAFYGTTENAVKTQIWIAICVYLMVACLNKMHGWNEKLSRILQVLSVNVFQKVPLDQLLAEFETRNNSNENSKQLMFNGF